MSLVWQSERLRDQLTNAADSRDRHRARVRGEFFKRCWNIRAATGLWLASLLIDIMDIAIICLVATLLFVVDCAIPLLTVVAAGLLIYVVMQL